MTLLDEIKSGRLRVVPVEATLPMQRAYFDEIDRNMHRVQTSCSFGRYDNHSLAYRKMLSTSPDRTAELLELFEGMRKERDEARSLSGLGCDAADGGAHNVVRHPDGYMFCGGCGYTIKNPTLTERARKLELRALAAEAERDALRERAERAEEVLVAVKEKIVPIMETDPEWDDPASDIYPIKFWIADALEARALKEQADVGE